LGVAPFSILPKASKLYCEAVKVTEVLKVKAKIS
jgi:hypothetical protein